MHQQSTINNQQSYLDMELLRFTTAGSVDDGKSTLIGRLLYDSKQIFEDQLEAVRQSSKRKGLEHIDLSLLTDGLKAEREQGITIDVAYRYFATPKRKFIIADTPGHVQYTRNMVTGASTANLALILVDARKGILEQTCRHSYIAFLLQIPHIILCINKMDLVDYDESVFNKIVKDYKKFSKDLFIKDVRFVPISALKGDNVVESSAKMNWYKGFTLMNLLENIEICNDLNYEIPRFPVQYIIRPHTAEHHDYRGYAGRIASGVFEVGDKIKALPSGYISTIKTIDVFENSLQQAEPPMSVSITLEDDIDISRGDMIVKEMENGKVNKSSINNQQLTIPFVAQEIEMMLCWFNEKKLTVGGKYCVKHASKETKCIVKEVKYKLNINTLEQNEQDKEIGMNDIGKVVIKTVQPLCFDGYKENRVTGSLILINESTNETVAAGMIETIKP